MKKYLYFILFLVIISSIQSKDDSVIRSELLVKIGEVLSNTKRETQDYSKYIKDLKSTPEEYMGKLNNPGELNQLSPKLNNQNIFNFLNNIITNKIAQVQTVNTADKAANSITEWFGAAKFENDALYYLLIKGITTGTIQQIEELKHNYKRECKRILWKKKCESWDEAYLEKRALNAQELAIATNTLNAKSLDGIRTEYFDMREKIDKELYDYAQKEREKGNPTPSVGPSQTIYSNDKKIKLLQGVKRLVEKKSMAMPAGYEAILKNIQTNTYINMETFFKKDIDEVCRKYQLPENVKKILVTVGDVSGPVIEQPVVYENRPNNAYLEEILGIAVKENERIFFAYVRSVSTGEIPTRFDYLDRKSCVHLIFKRCFHWKEPVAKPITEQEKQVIQNALSATNAKNMVQKVENMKVSQILISKTQKVYSPNNQWAAVISDDGLIYVGKNPDPIANKKFTIGVPSPKANAPYSLQIKENGTLYILNRNDDATWTSGTAYKGDAPYKLVLDDQGNLSLVDSKGKVIYAGK